VRKYPYKHLVELRTKLIVELVLKRKPVRYVEHETAMLVLDVLEALRNKEISPKEASRYFVRIEYIIDLKMAKRMSEDFAQMTAEAMLLDESGTKYGPDIKELKRLSLKVLSR